MIGIHLDRSSWHGQGSYPAIAHRLDQVTERSLRVLVAPDSFKGSLSASRAAAVISAGLRRAHPSIEIDLCPVADGGQGTVAAYVDALGGEKHIAQVHDPLGREIEAAWCFHRPSKTAVLELASACGLHLLTPEERDPMKTTTYGLGELILAALMQEAESIIVGLGDSATIDGGLGACQALGLRIEGVQGYATGGQLHNVGSLDRSNLHPEIHGVDLVAACDVENPLCGPSGAAQVFGLQKGATTENIAVLDRGLRHIAALLHGDEAISVGAGAAGGAAFGMQAVLGARLAPGVELVLDALGFDERAAHADLIITGEGSLDSQSLQGKACVGVARRARAAGVPVIALVGRMDGDLATFTAEGLHSCYALCDQAGDVADAMTYAEDYLKSAAERALLDLLHPGI